MLFLFQAEEYRKFPNLSHVDRRPFLLCFSARSRGSSAEERWEKGAAVSRGLLSPDHT